MEFDLGWILLGLPMAFGLGWMASRLDLRQLRLENRHNPKAYFKGLNHLLNEQQDQAIDAFIEAVQQDPDTSELHFALGNLFRRRGEFERAVRVHQHLLSRGDLSTADHDRARYALSLDFLKAGLLDRAEEVLRQLESTPYATQARIALLGIYERSRDWAHAADMAEQLSTSGQGSFEVRRAHYLCELASAQAKTDVHAAQALLRQAMVVAPGNAHAYTVLARLQQSQGMNGPALDTLLQAAQAVPACIPLIAGQMAELSQSQGRQPELLSLLREHYAQAGSLDVLEAIVQLDSNDGDNDTAKSMRQSELYAQHLAREPSLLAASRWIRHEPLAHEQHRAAFERALDRAAKPLQRYRCAACGFEAQQHFWQCPGCQSWDSYPPRRVEEL
jgi:lipopolysaccharide biosynthesis regulator YciM